MPHICADEILALVYALPFVGFAFYWTKTKIKSIINKKENK